MPPPLRRATSDGFLSVLDSPPPPPLPPPPMSNDTSPSSSAATPLQPLPAVAAAAPQGGLDIEDVLYSANSFWAVLKPVALTMFLASLVVVNVEFASDDQGVSVYTINDGDADGNGGDSASVKLGKSVVNALTIVGVICGATVVVVLLYKFRCMKCLFAYMAFSCTMLLGLMGGLLWYTALVRWDLPCDYLTFGAVLYNFAFVGVVAIFYQKGIPTWVTQGYLVMISVIMAWQLSRFEEWTGWSLLVVLALYDLCAVLTPCGPLRYLVGLMQEYNEPMPGLLYEAELPAHARHHHRLPPTQQVPEGGPTDLARALGIQPSTTSVAAENDHDTQPSSSNHHLHSTSPPSPLDPLLDGTQGSPGGTHLTNPVSSSSSSSSATSARLNSRLLEEGGPDNQARSINTNGGDGSRREDEMVMGGGTSDGDHHLPPPAGGGRGAGHHGPQEERSIKLGLGDFVFYSVLVSKAALYGFATCAACFLVIISGLGATLVLLSVFRKALPALPISIFLGVLFYLLTRVVIMPYIEHVVNTPIYV